MVDTYTTIEEVFMALEPLRDAQKTLGRADDPELENREAVLDAIQDAKVALRQLEQEV